ncbi:alpha/beta fold hydrolase (plasmid) [Embleya sp. NBC_00888]|uniref:S9 family peptidase n=1 Tax=Embleya sp. NBC_00888 TaxID=2975960 RepID=UPI002F9138AE|nr:alpha/beta fold hydrolase [Embleya sp. NBC_00888]
MRDPHRPRPGERGGDRLAGHAPVAMALPDAAGARDTAHRWTRAHACGGPSGDQTGEHVAFVCDRAGVPQVWTAAADTDEPHLLDTGFDPVNEVSWSPDGRWIAYTATTGGGGRTRVLCVRPDGSGRRVLADAPAGGSAYLGCWTRDGKAVAVTTESATADTRAASSASSPATSPGARRTGARPEPGRLIRAPAAERGAGERAGESLSTAYLVDPDGVRSPTLITAEQNAATLRVCDVSPDGRLALLHRGPRGRREAAIVSTSRAESVCVLRAADGDPWIGRFAPDGRTLWLRSDADREFAALLRVELTATGSLARTHVAAAREDADLELLSVSNDGRTAALSWNEGGRSEAEIVTLRRSGAVTRLRTLPLPHEVITRLAPAGTNGWWIALSGSRRRPGVWRLRADALGPTRTPWSSRGADVTGHGTAPVVPQPVRVRSRDGLSSTGWYYRAPDRDEAGAAPCVVSLHGGPEEEARPVFDALHHRLLARGIDVFTPNVRGSAGAGRRFVDADLGRGRFRAFDDVADCAAHIVLAGWADPNRLAVMGHSYGGYLTFAALTWYPELFRTGIAICGMSDLTTFFAGTEPWLARSAAVKYGHPRHDRELLRELSPMNRLDALRVPFLAVHGEHDTNVPADESRRIVRAARERGIPARILLLPDEGHEFLHTDSRVRAGNAIEHWMSRHLTA